MSYFIRHLRTRNIQKTQSAGEKQHNTDVDSLKSKLHQLIKLSEGRMEQSLSLDLDQHRALYMSTGHTGNNENKVMRISLQLLYHMLNINIK